MCARIGARDLAQRVGRDAPDGRHLLRREIFHVLSQLVEAFNVGLDVLLVVKLLADDDIEHRVKHRHVGAVLELQHAPGVAVQGLPARIHHDQLGAALRRLLEIGGGNRVVLGRVGADDDNNVGILHLVEAGRHGSRSDAFEQSCDRRGMTESCAVIDIVGAESGTHELLEEISFLVRAFGRAKACERPGSVAVTDLLEAGRGAVKRLFPGYLAEMRPWIGGVDRLMRHLRHTVLADHRLGESLRIADVVEAEAPLHAKPVLVGRAVAAGHVEEFIVLDMVSELAADAAIRADRVHLAVGEFSAHVVLVDQARRHQRAGGAGLHAFAASDAGRGAHRVVEVEHNLLAVAAAGHADDVVDLHFATGADAEIALDASVKVDCHGRMAAVARRDVALAEAAGGDTHAVGPGPELRLRIVRGLALGLIRDPQLEHHPPRYPGSVGVGLHLHALGRLADAACRQHAFALDVDHTGAAIAVGAIAGLRRIAQVRNLDALAHGDLPDGLAAVRDDFLAVEQEFYGFAGVVTRAHHSAFHHQDPIGFDNSSGKYFSTQSSGLGADWPRPQIDASRMALDNSLSSAGSQGPSAINLTAFSVPARQGVHWS